MKVDLSPAAVHARLAQVETLRRLCLSLAGTTFSRRLVVKNPTNDKVQRTAAALGRRPG